jgi:formylglycine-generating enzyme required for sulfatase activity
MKKTIIMASAIAAAALLAGCGGKGTRGKAAPETADIPIDMVFVEGGTFTMGCTEEQGGDCGDDEKPTRGVTVSGFYIGKYEVTQALWKAVMGSGHPVSREGEYLPVNNISGDDAQEFIRKLNAKTGKKYRLPTEAEWEYAARGGNKSKGYKYSGGNDIEE